VVESTSWDRVFVDANLATMVAGRAPYGARPGAALAVRGDRIAWIGEAAEGRALARRAGTPLEECGGRWLTPGLIDCHTHLVYGGDRVEEYEKRLNGVSYEDIARAGGGIQSTVRATRGADAASLRARAVRRLARLMAEGVTTLEVKSGYGLELDTERRMLEVARSLESEGVEIRTTFLGLHALPREHAHARERYVAAVSDEWLPTLHAAGLVDAVDAFCENIAFSIAESERLLATAHRLGVRAHVHAGQLSDLGAAELAARFGALSADHLEYLSDTGARALAAAGTVAVLLPGAYFLLRQTTPPPVPLLRAAGVPMAVATDCNPGTSPCTSILLMLTMACTLFGLTPEEALAGATRNAARALGLQGEIGTLEVGKRADLVLWDIERPAELAATLGANPCAGVWFRGVLRRSRQ